MTSSTNSQYFESKILTAPPHRLHLMLIEGAIRFARLAEEPLRRGDSVAAATPLLRAIDIVGELLAGVRDNKGPLNERMAAVYAFIFRRISEAKVNADAAALADAVRLLEFERQTWLTVCEKFRAASQTPSVVPQPAAFTPKMDGSTQAGFSCEA